MTRAFSLVELSIVLVVLGLLTGGILAGQSLIRAAELRSITEDMERYKRAMDTFKTKYNGLPGDLANAAEIWGADPDCGVNSNRVAKTVTCNGNDNGIIDHMDANREATRAWQQLANAGMIEGSFTGIDSAGAVGYDVIPGENIPKGRISSSGYSIFHFGTVAPADTNWFPNPVAKNILLFGGQATNELPWTGVLKPEEAWHIDTKMDDGKPATGRIFETENNTNCTNGQTDPNLAEYGLTGSTKACRVLYTLYQVGGI